MSVGACSKSLIQKPKIKQVAILDLKSNEESSEEKNITFKCINKDGKVNSGSSSHSIREFKSQLDSSMKKTHDKLGQ